MELEAAMKLLWIASATLLICSAAQAGNTSSNSSSNTSSNSSNGRSSVVHTHTWSVDSDDNRRRRSVGGTTRLERYTPGERRYRVRRERDDD